MDKRNAKKEIEYQLIKLILLNLRKDGLITQDEYLLARDDAIKQIKPLIGSLEIPNDEQTNN